MLRASPVPRAIAVLALAALCGCGGDGGGPGPGDTTPPRIMAIVPADGATDVGLIQRVEVEFSEPMDPATVNDTTIVVAGRTGRSYVDYDGETRTARVLPETLYVPEASYRITVSDDVTDESGNALSEPDTSGFETGTLDCEHLADYLERNDGILEAAPVELGQAYRMLALCDDDQDVFEITIPEAAKLAVHWQYRRADSVRVWHDVTRTDGYTYGTFSHTAMTGESRAFSFSLLPGTYYLGVWSPDREPYVLYDLDVSAGEPCPEDQYEDNDFRFEASPISPGLIEGLRGCVYDSDYFELNLAAGAGVTITVTNTSPGDPNRLVALSPSEGPAIVAETGTENPLSIEGTTTQAGIHYVQVTFYADDVVYDLNIEVAD